MKPYLVHLYNLLKRIWRKVKNIYFRVQSHLNSFNIELVLNWRRLWQRPNIKGHFRDDQSHDQLNLHYSWWITEHILYLEGESPANTFLGRQKVNVIIGKQFTTVRSVIFSLLNNQWAGLIFLDPTRTRTKKSWILDKDRTIADDNGQNLVDHLSITEEEKRLQIRDSLGDTLIRHCPINLRNEAKIILERLTLTHVHPIFHYHRPSLPFFFTIDEVIPVGYEGFLIIGWKYDPHNLLRSLTISTPLNPIKNINLDNLYPYHRSDVFPFLQQQGLATDEQAYGFCTYVSVSSSLKRNWPVNIIARQPCLTLHMVGDYTITLNPLAKSSDPFINRQTLVQLSHDLRQNWDIVEHCLYAATRILQNYCNRQVAIKKNIQYGIPVKKPIVSIIIPLYRQLDFLKTQLATFGNDPDIKQEAEIIYILDSPEQQWEVKNNLSQNSALYDLPLKLIIMNRNGGYSNANNFGAGKARGKYLLLMNSDVLPIKPGWLKQIVEFYKKTPEIGALSTKLLYPDDSIQHAGIYFISINPHYWNNAIYYHGFPSSYPKLKQSRAVPAVIGACLLISRHLYNRLGGLSNEYIIGDFEDTDLCLKCYTAGLENWYFAGTELYHLERQSVPLNKTYYETIAVEINAYLHTKKWGRTITKIMKKYEK